MNWVKIGSANGLLELTNVDLTIHVVFRHSPEGNFEGNPSDIFPCYEEIISWYELQN